jgi:hypothetical protein
MLASSVPAMKAALKTRIEAALVTAQQTALVSRGHPYPKAWAGHTVIIGRSAITERRRVASGTQENELYTVELLICAAGSAQDAYSGFEDAAYALRDLIVNDLHAWAPLPSGTWGHVALIETAGGSDQEGIEEDRKGAPKSRDATVTLTLNVTARLVSSG